MARSKKQILQSIESLRRQVREHEEKIRRNQDHTSQQHWKREIQTFEAQIRELETRVRNGDYETVCNCCGRTVTLRNYICPRCKTHQ